MRSVSFVGSQHDVHDVLVCTTLVGTPSLKSVGVRNVSLIGLYHDVHDVSVIQPEPAASPSPAEAEPAVATAEVHITPAAVEAEAPALATAVLHTEAPPGVPGASLGAEGAPLEVRTHAPRTHEHNMVPADVPTLTFGVLVGSGSPRLSGGVSATLFPVCEVLSDSAWTRETVP